ncbi:MAG: FG-GAP-like repeat-containing protein [Thermoanaerobaculia bacterium]
MRATCTVSCTATVPSTASVGASVPFQSTATPCNCSGGTSYHWTFGDGADSTAANPSHSYGAAGTYNWQLTVTSESTNCVKSGSITIGSITPPAGTYSGTTSLGQPFSITVNGSSQITGWMIGFSGLCGGTGSVSVTTTCAVTNGSFSCGSANCIPFSTQTSISGTFTSLYNVSGSATLKAMPGTSTCCTQTPTYTASRSPGPLTATASSDVTSGTEPLLVNFTGSATGGTAPYSYHWDFGDCTTSSSQNPSHSYTTGNWGAVLTVTDSTSAEDDSNRISITALQAPGVTVTPTSGLITSEGGTDAMFTVVLDTAPSANVTIEIHPSDTTEALLSTNGITELSSVTLTFTTGNWSTPKTVTVHGQNDNIDDGNVAFTVVTSPTDSTDLSYDNIDPDDVTATNNDNDTAAVTVTPLDATVSETATTDTFTIVLVTEPTGNVVIDVASLDTGEATVSPAQLTFMPGDWFTPQTVTVTGVDDAIADGDQITTIDITTNGSTADPIYAAINPANVAATTVDDEIFEIISTNPAQDENAAPRNTNIEATASEPVDALTVTQATWRVQGDQTGRIAGTYGAAGATLQLNPANDLKPGETIKLTATSGVENGMVELIPYVWQFTAATAPATGAFAPHPAMPSFASFGGAITPALGDLDGDGDLDAVFSTSSGTGETVWLNDGTGVFTQDGIYGAGDTYDVALGDLDNDGDLDFVSANRLENETVWINDGSANFTQHATTFNGDSTIDVSLGDIDGDGDLDAVLSNQSGAQSAWLNDGTGGFTAHPTTPTFGSGNMNAIPLGDLDGDGDLDAITANQNGAEQVWMNDGTGSFSASTSFGGDNSYDVALGDVDGDGDLDAVVANMSGQAETVWSNSGNGTFSSLSSFGTGDSRAVALGDVDGDGDLDAVIANAGTEAETIWLNDGSGTFSAHPSVATINSGTDTWGLALGDLDGDGDLDVLVANAGNPHQNETVWLNERIVVAPSSGLTTTESGGTATFTVVLGAAPAADVTIDVSTSDATEALVSSDGVTQLTSVTLTFTTLNWFTPQTVTLHGQNDAIDDGNVAYTIVTAAAVSSDPSYSGVNAYDVSASNTDNDTAGVTVVQSGGTTSVTEAGSSDTFAVALNSEPTGDVVIDIASANTAEAMVLPAQLTFTSVNWMTAQTVTVTGVNDAVDDGNQNTNIALTMNAGATLDAVYDAINPPDVTAVTVDDEKTATTTTLISSPNPSISAQSVTFTATVSGGTGNVTFLDGATPMATVALTGSSASFSTSSLSLGSHPITASYGGDTNFFGSTSSAVNQTVNAATFGAPPFVIASPLTTSSIQVTWSAVSGATSYEVFRTTSTAIAYSSIGTTGATSLTNGSLTANTTYLYKVRAINGGGPSALSTVDAATTTIFTDPTLTSAIRAKAAHMNELRIAVNAMRAAAVMSAFTFTDPSIAAGTTKWKAVHVTELRTALDAARAAIGLSAITWTDPTISAGSTKIKGAHITQLRTGVQ